MAPSHSIVILCLVAACAAPRAVTETGQVTPHQQLRGGVTYSFNGASATAGELFDGFSAAVDAVVEDEAPTYDDTARGLSEGLIAFAVDPSGSSGDIWMRYGLRDRMDLGYRFASGTHIFDSRFQFLGSAKDPTKLWSGSIGIQYSSQSFEMPSLLGLDKLQSAFGFEAKRQDILLPVIISRSFGAKEKYGAFTMGLVLGRVGLDYGFKPIKLVEEVSGNAVGGTPLEAIHDEQSYLTYGGFGSVKAGYKRIYLLASLGVYYQDYGTYQLLDDHEISLSGFTIVPSLGAEFRLR